jgi:hypothetical protein
MPGDFDDDGHVGATDLAILQSHIGQFMFNPSPIASAAPSAIPEPAPIALGLMATAFLLIQHKCRRGRRPPPASVGGHW